MSTTCSAIVHALTYRDEEVVLTVGVNGPGAVSLALIR